MIVLPAIDLRQGRVVRLRQGRAELETVYSDDPAQVARGWADQGAEWLHVVNLDGALGTSRSGQHPGRSPLSLRLLQEIRNAAPDAAIQFGGGLRTIDDVGQVLGMGATRAVLGTVAVQDPELLTAAMRRYGSDRVALALDARSGRVLTHGWQQSSQLTAVGLGIAMRDRGVRHAIYTDTMHDGMLDGVNVEDTAALAQATGLQVIASGGVATLSDIVRLRERESAGIVGVIVGQALYSGALSLPEVIRAAQSPSPRPGSPRGCQGEG